MITAGKNILKIQRHKIIRDKGLLFAECLRGSDRNIVLSIVSKSKEWLKSTGKENNMVYALSVEDMAVFNRAVKRYVQTDYRGRVESRLKNVPTDLKSIKGICKECIKNDRVCNYEMCKECYDRLDIRLQIWYAQKKRGDIIKNDFDRAVDRTHFSDELIGNWTLLVREGRRSEESKHINNVLKEFIRDELMNEFITQNKQLIKKYELWQSQ